MLRGFRNCYCSNSGVVYGLALDATKTFDRVKYDKLFNLFVTRKIKPLFIRLLSNVYLNQKLNVSYNGVTSRCFSVSNGIKQGGVLSPTLFGLYVDGMLQKRKESGYGCKVGSKFCGGLVLQMTYFY